jgi:hypothetical protein
MLLLGAFGATMADANAKRGLTTGFASVPEANPEGWITELNEARAAGADLIKIGAWWQNIARSQPADPRNPADRAYDFAHLDALIRDAHANARGLRILLQIAGAPSWAEGEDRAGWGPPAGTWKPRPGPANDFGHAIARRYSGSFPDPANPGRPLPRLRHFQIFNEPNLPQYLTPQWEGNRPTGALVYRRLLNAFYRGIKSVHQSNVVVTGGTAPYGDDPGGDRTRPLRFWRTVMCLRPNLRPASCPKPGGRARFDVLAHHPINTSGGPFQGAAHRDDASSPDMWKLRRTLRAAERHETIRPGGRRALWATELWYNYRGGLDQQARWISESLYLFWRGGASVALNFLVRDNDQVFIRSGVYHADGTKKPAFTAFRFPFVAFKRGRRVELWGKAPRQGRVVIRRGGSGQWRRVTRVRSGANRVFHARVRMRGKPQLQAVAPGGEQSLIYKVR